MAHYDRDGAGRYVLRKVGYADGSPHPPEMETYLGYAFPDARSLQLAVLATLRPEFGGTIDNVLIDASVSRDWVALCQQAAQRMDRLPEAERCLREGEGIEAADALPDGRLRIWVRLPEAAQPGGVLEMFVEPRRWRWRRRPN